MIKRIHGINIAVADLDQARAHYETIFGVESEPLGKDDFAFPGLVGARLDVGGTKINLIASTEANTPVAQFVAKRGEGVFLIAAEVDDVGATAAHLRKNGAAVVLDKPARGSWGAVNFVHPKSMHGVQWELYEPKKG